MQDRIARLGRNAVLQCQMRDTFGFIEFSVNQILGGLEFHQHHQTSHRRQDRVATRVRARSGSLNRACILCRGRFHGSYTQAGNALKRLYSFQGATASDSPYKIEGIN